MTETVELFGEDIVFDLRGLLTERYGSNLRSRLAHGLVDDDSFYSSSSVYAWWAVLRLCLLPILVRQDANTPSTIPTDQ